MTVLHAICLLSYALSLAFCTGILTASYNSAFKKHHQMCLSLLKRFGFGQRVIETRIVTEVEEMLSRIRAEQGRAFDMRHLTTSCVANVIISMLLGRRFDNTDRRLLQFITDVNEIATKYSFELEIFPLLQILPYYKRIISDMVLLNERIADFVNAVIAECRRVCHYARQHIWLGLFSPNFTCRLHVPIYAALQVFI